MSAYTLFWFDVEDYIEPQSDEALKGLLDIFEQRSARATWKLVGEKARVLERRGRRDIIRLLQRQDIGYHTDYHSLHPVLAEYLEEMGWEDGIAELCRRESQGYRDLKRICGPASTFGQAGGSWAPQLYPLLKEWEIPLFMDEAGHIGLEGRPFWYCGVLHVNRLEKQCTRMDFRKGEEGLEAGKRAFDAILEEMGGEDGLISIYYHPCEWATKGFWDGVNFGRGRNTPPARWQSPPLYSPEQMRQGLRLFDQYLAYVQARPGVELLTGRQLLNLLPDRAPHLDLDPAHIARLAAFADGQITYQLIEDASLSPAELFALVADCLEAVLRDGRPPAGLAPVSPWGPTRRAASTLEPGARVPAEILAQAAADSADFVRCHQRLPDRVWLGVEQLSPADFLLTAADLLAAFLERGTLPEEIAVRAGSLALEPHVREKVWGWVIFPEGFDAPRTIELARLQTWTLKPALWSC